MKVFWLLSFCVLCSVVQFGEALDCHQCASKDDQGCMDPYDQDNVDGCGDTDTHCLKYKIVNKLYDSGNILGDPRVSVTVSRGCIRADNEGDWCKVIEADAGFMFKCICSTDSCNAASGLGSQLGLVIGTLGVLAVIRRLVL